jgi:hypothetical protein
MSNVPNSEPRSFKTPQTPETRALDRRDVKDAQDLKDAEDLKNVHNPLGGEAEVTGSGAHADDVEDNRDHKTEKALDHGLKETFPASDPVSIQPGAD